MKHFLFGLLALAALPAHLYAQYPFESAPAIKYKEYKGWKMDMKAAAEQEGQLSFDKTIPNFFGNESLRLRLTAIDSPAISYISFYRGKKLLGKVQDAMSFFTNNLDKPIYVGDVNGDSLTDIKLVIPYNGCGLAALNMQVIYLFQQPGGKFVKVSYMDVIDGKRPERDLDGDGNYEIITMSLQPYKTHNYWTFNVYNFTGGKLVNVNDKVNYPIMVQYLNRENYKPADLPKEVLQKNSMKKPEELDVRSMR